MFMTVSLISDPLVSIADLQKLLMTKPLGSQGDGVVAVSSHG